MNDDLLARAVRHFGLKKVKNEWRGVSPFVPEVSPGFFIKDNGEDWHDFATGRRGKLKDLAAMIDGGKSQ